MTLIAVYVFILIIQIIYLIKCVERNTNKNWQDLLFIEIASFIPVLSFIIYSFFIKNKFTETASLLTISSIVAFLIFAVILVLSIRLKEKYKSTQKEELLKQSLPKKVLKLILVFFVTAIFLLLEHIPNHINYEENKKVLGELQENILNHLNERYGDGNFKIVKLEAINNNYSKTNILYDDQWDVSGPTYDYKVTISTKYMKENFELLINSKSKDYKEDNFIETYLIENNEMSKTTTLESYLKSLISQPLKSYDAYIEAHYLYINENFYTEKYGQIPTTEQLLKSTSFETGEITITRKFTADEETAFKEYMMELINIYLKYYVTDYSPQDSIMFRFNFSYDNPFATGHYYKDGGYVRILSDTILIYNKAQPIKVDFDKILLFELTSTKLNCDSIYLKVYEDNIYEYIDNIHGFSFLGVYNFDISKILDNIKSSSSDDISSYTLITPDEKYTIYENEEVEKFLESIDVNLHQCLN